MILGEPSKNKPFDIVTSAHPSLTRPPILSRASYMVTLAPLLIRTSAHLNPDMPAPTIATFGIFPLGRMACCMLTRFLSGDGEE